MRSLATSAILVAACTSHAPAATPKPEPASAPELGTWLTGLAGEGSISAAWLTGDTIELPDAPSLPDGPGAMVSVAADAIVVLGEPVAQAAHPDAKALAAAMGKLAKGPAVPIYVTISPGAPWPAVVATIHAARDAGLVKVSFLFRTKTAPSVAPPPPSSIDAAMNDLAKKSDPAAKVGLLQTGPGMDAQVFAKCQPALDLEKTVSTLGETEKRAKLAAELPKAIGACRCAVELPAVKRLFWSAWDHDGPTWLVARPMQLGKGTLVEEPAGTTWMQASAAVLDKAKTGAEVDLEIK